MNWMFEPRSINYDYDDSEGGGYSPPMKWHEIPLALFIFVLALIYCVIIEFLLAFYFVIISPLGIIYSEFCSAVKRVSESGELEFPGLVFTGIAIAVILPILILSHLFSVSDHPIVTLCSLIFILRFTIAPLAGLALRFFKKNMRSFHGKDQGGG